MDLKFCMFTWRGERGNHPQPFNIRGQISRVPMLNVKCLNCILPLRVFLISSLLSIVGSGKFCVLKSGEYLGKILGEISITFSLDTSDCLCCFQNRMSFYMKSMQIQRIG